MVLELIKKLTGKDRELVKECDGKIKELKDEGERLFNEGKYSEALDKFNEVLRLNPNNEEAEKIINKINKIKKIIML